MGRNHRQRSQLPANRELRRAINHREFSRAYGIRRLLDESSKEKMRSAWDVLQDDGDIPESVIPRFEPAVTLLPMWQLERQMRNGLILAYKLGQAVTKLEQNDSLRATINDPVKATIGRVTVNKRRAISVHVESPELDAEQRLMYEILGRIGYKGAHKKIGLAHHITLGDSEQGSKISLTEQRHIEHLGAEFCEGDTVTLQPWAIYPELSSARQYNDFPLDY